MIFAKPKANDVFTISTSADAPSIEFETDATGAHIWHWSIVWGTLRKAGIATSTDNKWNANSVIVDLGGTLTVRAEAFLANVDLTKASTTTRGLAKISATITVKVKGTNPAASDVTTYLTAKPNSAGFDKIIAQESKYVHFNKLGEPIKSFDSGYGMCQLTMPTPSYEQIWSWKRNLDGGLKLFDQKRASAIVFLTQSGRTYSADQLTREAVCRWNGGAYHEWDATAKKWVRQSRVLCDSKTGNIGWDMTDAENKGKTESDLHKRDSASFSKPPAAGAHWKYSGVCYADHVLG